MTQFDYSQLVVTKPNAGYTQSQLTKDSHYNDALTVITGVTGYTRNWGDA